MPSTTSSAGNSPDEINTDEYRVLKSVDEQERDVRVRDYQLELLRKALRQNVIAYMLTGTGKTLIAVMLVKHYADTYGKLDLKDAPEEPKIVVCVVPTTLLVAQQAAVFRRHVNVGIGEYTGASRVDNWGKKRWTSEAKRNRVFVITPTILMEAMRKACVCMSSIHLLIFDEAHHCRKRHPYAQVMDYYWKVPNPADRPRIFGMTASPVNTKLTDDQGKSQLSIVQQLRHLETALGAAKWVPEPAKEHLKYLEPEALRKDSMLHRTLQVMFSSAFRLSCLRKRLVLLSKEEQLEKLLKVPPESQPEYLKGNHKTALRANPERIGFWLGNGMCHCLFNQGPYCAALLFKAHLMSLETSKIFKTLSREDTDSNFMPMDEDVLDQDENTTHGPGDGMSEDSILPKMFSSKQLRKKPEAQLEQVQQEWKELEAFLQANGMSLRSVEDPLRAVCECIFETLHLLILMLVCDNVMAQTLIVAAHELLQPYGSHPVNTKALVDILEAALSTVPPAVIEKVLLAGNSGYDANVWRERMQSDLFSSKVCCLFQELYKHKAHAGKALEQSGATSTPPHMLGKESVRKMLTAQTTTGTLQRTRWACLVFNERQACSFVLNELLARLPAFSSFIRSEALMGETKLLAREHQDKVLALFRTGQCNLLFTTSVAEEGLDIQNCSLVICYDVPNRPLSLVQTVGRARARNARVVFMEQVGADGVAKADRVQEMDRYTASVRELVLVREALGCEEPTSSSQKVLQEAHLDTVELAGKLEGSAGAPQAEMCYTVESTQASSTPTQAVSLLQRYCTSLMCKSALIKCGWNREAAKSAAEGASSVIAERLWVDHLLGSGVPSAARSRRNGDCSSDLQALRPHFLTDSTFDAEQKCTVFQSTVYMPRVCPIKQIEGLAACSPKQAQELAALEAIKQLHELKEVDDFLKPASEKLIKKILSASSSKEDWLEERIAGDRINENSWESMQTWRKPPDMLLPRNIPVALDYRAASYPAISDLLSHSQEDLHKREQDTPLVLNQKAADETMHVHGDGSCSKKKYWLYSFQISYERREEDSPSGAEEKELKELSLGILLMAPLPAVPGFQIHLDKDVHSSSCCIVPGGTVHLTDEELSKLQGYHTSLLKFLFRAEDDGNDVPTKVRLAVSSAERVKVSISVCRLVQSLQGDKVDEPISRITSVSQREAGSSDPSADVTQQARVEGDNEKPAKPAAMHVPPEEWSQSSAGAWYTIVPVKRCLEQAHTSGSFEAGSGAAPMDTYDAPLHTETPLVSSADTDMSTDDIEAPAVRKAAVAREDQEPCNAKHNDADEMLIDWSSLGMYGQGLVPLTEFVGKHFWKLGNTPNFVKTSQQEAIEVQKEVSKQLRDRIIVANHSESQQQYLFYGFMPSSNILMPWPYNKTRKEILQERQAVKQRMKEAAAKNASECEILSNKRQKNEHIPAEDPTMTWESSGLYRERPKRHTGGTHTPGGKPDAGMAKDVQMNVNRPEGDENTMRDISVTSSKEGGGGIMGDGSKEDAHQASPMHAEQLLVDNAQVNIEKAKLCMDGAELHIENAEIQVDNSSIAGTCHVQLRPVCNPLKRKAADEKDRNTQSTQEEDDVPVYTSFKDFYEKKYSLNDLSDTLPLMNVRRLPMHSSATNYLVPPTGGSRRNEMLRTAQHQAIEKTLSDAHEQQRTSDVTTGDPKVPEDGASQGPKLVAELCSIHPLCVSTMQALQFIPSLMYRVEGLLVAEELKERLCPTWLAASEAPSSNKVLEAITHRSCADSIDYERYELLGDAFLKFATANHLYTTTCKDANEGILSTEMHRRVSNGTLWRAAIITKWLGVDLEKPLPAGSEWRLRGVADSLRISPFRLNYWTPPGMLEQARAPRRRVSGKVVSDAMEAIIGVFYESLGPEKTCCWLACLGLLPGAPTDPTEWKIAAGSQSMASKIQNQIAQSKQTDQKPAGLCSIDRDGGPTETFLPSQAFEVDTSEHRKTYCTMKSTRTTAGDTNSSQVLQEMQEALDCASKLPALPCPKLNTMDQQVCSVLAACVGSDRLRDVVPLEVIPITDLPQSQPLTGTKLADRVEKYLYCDGLQLLQHHLENALAAARSGSMHSHARSAKHTKQANTCVRLSKVLGYQFKDPQLERTARIHSYVPSCFPCPQLRESKSWINLEEEDSGRLEFLGDAVLGLIVTSYIFYCLHADSQKNLKPGQLSDLRSSIVKNDCLAFMACHWNLQKCLLHSSPALHDKIEGFAAKVQQKLSLKQTVAPKMSTLLYVITGCGMGYMSSIEHPKALGDIMESAIGAVYLDSGMDISATYPVVMRLLYNLEGVSPTTYPKHPTTIVSRIALKSVLPTVRYEVATTDKVADCRFCGRARVRNMWLSDICYGSSRFSVRTKCAEQILKHLKNDPTWLQKIHKDEQGSLFVQGTDIGEDGDESDQQKHGAAAKSKQEARAEEANVKKKRSMQSLHDAQRLRVQRYGSVHCPSPQKKQRIKSTLAGIQATKARTGLLPTNLCAGNAVPCAASVADEKQDEKADVVADGVAPQVPLQEGERQSAPKVADSQQEDTPQTSSSTDKDEGLWTLQELQSIQDSALDACMQKNEVERLLKFTERSQQQGGKSNSVSNAGNKPRQGSSKRVSRKTETGILKAAGTGQLSSEVPQSSLLKHLSSAGHFLAASVLHLDKADTRYLGPAEDASDSDSDEEDPDIE